MSATAAALISATPALIDSIFGTGTNTSGNVKESYSGTTEQTNIYDSLVSNVQTGKESQYLDIDEAGVERIVQELLSGTGGLAEIFSGEQASGLYSSSVAAQESGDLVAKVAGEIAKLTAKQITEQDVREDATKTGSTASTQAQDKDGLLSTLTFGLL